MRDTRCGLLWRAVRRCQTEFYFLVDLLLLFHDKRFAETLLDRMVFDSPQNLGALCETRCHKMGRNCAMTSPNKFD